MRPKNLVILSGRVASDVRMKINEDGRDAADFVIMQDYADADGKVTSHRHLCRVMGAYAKHVQDAALGAKVSLEGTIRSVPDSGEKYVESWNVQVDR